MNSFKRMCTNYIKKLNLFLLTFLGIFPACHSTRSFSTADTPVIRIKGSDTMVTLAQSWAEKFMQQHRGVAVYVEGGGTATGIEALIKGDIEICTASRPLRPEEVQRLAKRQQNIGIAHLVAKDGLSVYLHPNNPVRNLTLAQVKDIYPGRISNWREAGGKDEAMVVLSRAPSSGTYLYFCTIKKPQGVVKLFIDWVLSKDGQRVVKEIDYIPLFDLP